MGATTLDYAKFYAEKNLPVFPCWEKAKNPIPTNGLKAATTNPAQLQHWWGKGASNLAIATGNGIVVIDLDNHPEEGKCGDDIWREWEDEFGKMPDTWECLTGSGGRHLYFRCDDASITVGTNLAPGVDFRGLGGYVLAPPSVHPNGRRYEWEASHHPEDVPIADLPEPLHALILSATNKKTGAAPAIPEIIREGTRNDVLFRLACSLQAKGLSDVAIMAAVEAENKQRCDPPLPRDEVETICASAARYEKGNAEPEEATEKKYASIRTTEEALRELGISVRYNLLLKEVEVEGLPGYFSKENAAIVLPPYLMDYMKASGVKGVTRQGTEAFLDCIADANRYNPIKEYLLSGSWDGKDRLPEIYRLLGISNGRHQMYVRKWFLQCVAIGLNGESGLVSADGALVLQGGQGTGKTSFFRIMAPFDRAFVEGAVIDMRIKDTQIRATKGWITELGELDSTIKKDQSSLKAFITLPEDNIRLPYARTETRSPRRTSFCGTVNPKDYLKDETGSRRFWTVPVEAIDKKRLFSLPKEWIAQVWYQTYHMYLNDPDGYRLTDEEMQALQEDNREFEQPLPYELELLDILDFSMPEDQWEWWSAVQLAERVDARADARRVGKAVAKILKNYTGADHKGTHYKKNRGTRYVYVPLRHYQWVQR